MGQLDGRPDQRDAPLIAGGEAADEAAVELELREGRSLKSTGDLWTGALRMPYLTGCPSRR
jgi:hypothetical protein